MRIENKNNKNYSFRNIFLTFFQIVKEWDNKIKNFKTVLYRENLELQNEV